MRRLLFDPVPAVGSSHRSLSSSSAEERLSSPITDPAYSSSVSAGGRERTPHSVTDGVLAGGTESSASYAETVSSPGPARPTSVEQSGTANASAGSVGFTDFATETLFARSSKMPTYSSFQNDPTSKLMSPSIHFGWKFTLSCLYLCCIQSSCLLVHAMQCVGTLGGGVFIQGLKVRPHLAGESFQK